MDISANGGAAPAAADPAAEDMSTEQSAGTGYTIEIAVSADGKISVGCESAAAEGAEAGAEGAPEAAMATQPAKDIKDALVIALGIYKNNGEMPEADDSDAQFASGYKGGE